MSEPAITKEPVTDRLEKLFYQLLDTLDRQTQERQLLVREKEELGKLTQLLINQTKEIGQYENGIRKRIQDCIKESANDAMNHIERVMVEKNSQSLERAAHNVNHACQSMESVLDGHRRDKNIPTLKIFIAAILSGILSSALMIWVLMPKPILPLTAEQIGYLKEGQMLAQMWPKLSKQEKDRLKAISYELANSR